MIVSFEGIDGSGKSTQARLLAKRLAFGRQRILFVREPGGTDVSERIRSLLLDPALDIDDFAEMLLFSAARAQLVRKKVIPFHGDGGIVVCDRFFDSTVAYQGGGRGVADPFWLGDFQRRVCDGVVPDRTYLIQLDPALARERLGARGDQGETDRMESAGLEFFSRVANAYADIALAEPDRFFVVDGTRSIDAIEQEIWSDFQRCSASGG